MRWTDFCHLTSSYQYPRIVGSPCIKRLRASAVEEIACYTTVRFASAGLHRLAVWLVSHFIARAFSSRRDACTPYLCHPCRLSHRARDARACTHSWEPPRPPSDRPRERAARETTRDDFHLAKAFAPRCPFGHPARAYPGAVALPPRYRLSTPLLPGELLRAPRAWVPVHAPRCHGTRFSEPRRRSPTSATEFDARTHPTSCRSCEPQSAHAGIHRRVPLAWTRQVAGRGTRKRRARALDDSACPSRGAPGTRVTGSTHYPAWTTW
jgi:hypothetical protein